ncbi:MAG: MipA/OmpV family protein [Verrucomicrobia bacterium]|nr:MipA/OmpV family protein [Verrucomicrobiota bacterium]
MWMLGAGVGVFDSPYEGTDSQLIAFPLVTHIGERFKFLMSTATYAVMSRQPWSVDLLAEIRFGGYDAGDSDALQGMDDRDMTLELGAALRHEASWGIVTLKAQTDVLGKHGGQELTLTYGIDLGGEYVLILPEVGLKWKSRDLVDYYYGVETGEATAARPAYSPGSTVDPVASLTVQMPVSRHWSLFGLVGLEWLSDEIADSPIVEDDYEITTIVGVSYLF